MTGIVNSQRQKIQSTYDLSLNKSVSGHSTFCIIRNAQSNLARPIQRKLTKSTHNVRKAKPKTRTSILDRHILCTAFVRGGLFPLLTFITTSLKGVFCYPIKNIREFVMKFSRSSKTAEVGAPASSPEFPSFFSSKSKDADPTDAVASDSKSSRLFMRKKREDSNFDMLKTVNGDDDTQKPSRKLFGRKNNDEKSNSDAAQSRSTPSIFSKSSKGAEDEAREGASSRSLFRKKSKDQGDSVAGTDNVRDAAEAAPVASEVATKTPSKLFSKSERSQIKVVVHSFSPDTDVIKVEKDDVPPTLDASNHVLIKVQVCETKTNTTWSKDGN